jgi:hypothetical protein
MSAHLLSAATLRDFPDWLSPIVVKELRQGLRQRSFVLLFIFLQIVMALVVFSALLGAPTQVDEGLRAGQTISSFFFVLFGLAALVVQPLRGIGALAGEKLGGTLDLLQLTRLNVWRITLGKWLALFGQTTLLLIAILPYLIMRYYLGGMQLFNELLVLFTMYILSGTLTGVMVGLSATPSVVFRVILALILGGLVLSMVVGLMEAGMGRGMGRLFMGLGLGTGFLWAYLGSVAVAVFVGYYFLEVGATHLAPPSENRSTRKRLLGLAMLAAILFFFKWQPGTAVVVSLLLAVVLVIDALTESPDFTASVMRPFQRFGVVGKAAAYLLCPGWATGTLFTGVVVALVWFGFSKATTLRREDGMEGFGLLVFASLLVPALIASLAKRGHRNTFLFYIAVLLGVCAASLVLIILGFALDGEKTVPWLFFLLPPVGVMGIDELNGEDGYDLGAAVCLVGWWVILLLAATPWLSRMGSMQPVAPQPSPSDESDMSDKSDNPAPPNAP